ncbi:TPA: transposase, partial [Candidatus Uhrbacteria bacterium]|nr:transposase [Candidatus Uhrbacteria bacterium]
WYFVTICTNNRECWFGDVVKEKMQLSPLGRIVNDYWLQIPKQFDNAVLDGFIVMPNHIHGIIVINNDLCERMSLPTISNNSPFNNSPFNVETRLIA